MDKWITGLVVGTVLTTLLWDQVLCQKGQCVSQERAIVVAANACYDQGLRATLVDGIVECR